MKSSATDTMMSRLVLLSVNASTPVTGAEEEWKNRDGSEEERATPRYADDDAVEVLLRGNARPDARHEPSVLLQVLCQLLLLEHDERIEEREDDHQDEDDHPVPDRRG